MTEINLYLNQQHISFTEPSIHIVEIAGKTYQRICPIEDKLFDEDFHLLVEEETQCDNYIFTFGGVWYWTPKGSEKKPQLNKVKFLGKMDTYIPTTSFLGVHGGYELLNGVGLYEQWVKKAKFMGVEILGICEKNTLAGVLKFQIECNKNGIRPIIGATYSVYRKKEDYKYDIKCYVENETGWTNLLMMNKEVNVINPKYITEERFFELTDGLVLVLDPKSVLWSKLPFYNLGSVRSFYQLDTVIFDDPERDKDYLLNLKQFIQHEIPPIAITDAYYLNQEDAYLKIKLNQISGVREYKSQNQYFKSKDDYLDELDNLFKNEERSLSFFTQAFQNEVKLIGKCQFQISQVGKHLPVYKMTEEEKKKFETNEDLFWDLIIRGLNKKIPKEKHTQYLERVNEEFEVIDIGGFVDYFLILWDIVEWCRKNEILVGIGRGSAGGSVVSYLLDIIKLDPIEFNLIFSRFLNLGRVKNGSLPDVDLDFAGNRRGEVKQYMEQRYGITQVCSVGTYGTLQVKAAIKDLARLLNISPQEVNYVTTALEDDEESDDVISLFKNALHNKMIMAFMKQNPTLINDALTLIGQPKSQSIHACATLILPDENDIFHWIPVKNMSTKDGENCLVSEWEGGELESAGFLKEDILGIRQLDKFRLIIDLIKKNRNIDVDIYTLLYDDEKTYRYFRKGWTQDVFHFGAKGLTGYIKQIQPETIDDLLTAIALYRPGPIESNLHNEYVLRKNGEKEVEYLWGTDKITKHTLGILAFQEQIMTTCVEVGGFNLTDSDDIRRGMGKKKQSVVDAYKIQFIEGAKKKGCPETEAENIWNTMEKFAGYAFNASHAAAYSITGYICNYLKAHYPLEFWTAAFEFVDEARKGDVIPQFIAEIHATGSIKLSSPDINQSTTEVHSNYLLNTIYWAISSIKQVGGIATEQIVNERNQNGPYFSFEEFFDRHSFKGSKVNKAHIENLVFSGAFDEIEKIEFSSQRKRLIDFYREKKRVKIDEEKDILSLAGNNLYEDWWWNLQQRKLCGLANFDYEELCDKYLTDFKYIEQSNFQSTDLASIYWGTGGIVLEVIERSSKKKGKYCSIKIESNSTPLWITIFPDMYKSLLNNDIVLVGIEGSILLISGLLKFDDFKKENILKFWDNSEIKILN